MICEIHNEELVFYKELHWICISCFKLPFVQETVLVKTARIDEIIEWVDKHYAFINKMDLTKKLEDLRK